MGATNEEPDNSCDAPDSGGKSGKGPIFSRRSVLRFGAAAAGVAATSGVLSACGSPAGGSKAANEIVFASAKFDGSVSLQTYVDAYNKAQNKYHCTFRELPPPSSSTEVHQQLVQSLGRKDGSIDVFTQDVIWIAEFAGAGWAQQLDSMITPQERAQYFPSLVQACTYKGKFTALPLYVDFGLLYYRKDLLSAAGFQVPTQWQDLVSQASQLQQQGKAQYGYLWQGKQAEILVCDLVEMVGSAGGSILGPDGKTVLIDQPPAVEAVQFLVDTIRKSKISPPDVLSWDEDVSRTPFTGGRAAFLRNWTNVYAVAQNPQQSQIVDKAGIAPLPAFPGGKSSACLGGYQLGMNASSRNKDGALDFMKWLSSQAQQLQLAKDLSLAPTLQSAYDSAELKQTNPFMVSLKDVLLGGTPRPVTPKYAQVSLALQSGISNALNSGDVQGSLKSTKTQIEQALA
jgi:multiple sugar transport system substrate-binding protein